MPKRFLSKEVVERYTNYDKRDRHFIRNPEKRELFKQIINSNFLKRKGNENRITAFNRIWKKAQRVSKMIYGNDLSILQRSKHSADFVREYTYYKSSMLQNFHYSKIDGIEKSVKTAEFKTYSERVKNFMQKYGDFIVKQNLTLNDYFEMFKNGEIDKETMNEIISLFKTGTDYYKGQVGSD